MRLAIPFCVSLFSLIVCLSASAQKITGRVLSEDGKGVSHATIQFVGRPTAVVTDADGNFIIPVTKLPDTMIFSSVAFESYRVVITEETVKDPNFEIVLLSTRSKAALSEVVVTGYETSPLKNDRMAKRDLAPAPLSGKVPGVIV